ncbi:MAG: NeuD/PglB/VioB family sugar acetyltransferase [bacterium]
MKNLCIVGTGSQARYVIETAGISKNYNILGLVDLEDSDRIGKNINGYNIKCLLEDIAEYFLPTKCKIVVAYGDNNRKSKVVEQLQDLGYSFTSIIHPSAYISKYVEIGEGCILNPNVTILPNVKIGNHVIIHSGSVIEHDNELGDFVNVAPGVCTGGNVTVGDGTYLYTGAVVIPKIKIGKWVVVGAGAVVRNRIKNNDVIAGVPGRSIKH